MAAYNRGVTMMLRRLRREKETDSTPMELAGRVASTDFQPGSEIPQQDPLHTYLLQAGGPVEIDGLDLASPAVEDLRASEVVLVVPLVAQGELLGTLNLGRRLSDQPYSSEDRKLLANLASQVAPAVKVAQLVRQQEQAAKERERIDQELRVAALIQQTLLPKDLPSLSGWSIDAYYRPAREVGGDFYDFIALPDNKLGLVVGDVTDKGVPAALVMATTRSTLRSVAQHNDDPGAVLAAANEELVAEIPEGMFITCLYGVLEPRTGLFRYANAGHNLPYVRTSTGVVELRATGMPLGLLPGMTYEEKEQVLAPGETMLLSSDGIVEAHDSEREMFGFPRMMGIVAANSGNKNLIQVLLRELDSFVGPTAEQEDDVTLVTVTRSSSARESSEVLLESEPMRSLASFSLASVEGNERLALEPIEEAATAVGLSGERLERLKTAVAEATMNAIEHGNRSDPDREVEVAVLTDDRRLVVRIRDQGEGGDLPEADTPDIEAKLAGEQAPRGWGLFLIENMVDEWSSTTDNGRHMVEIVMNLEGAAE